MGGCSGLISLGWFMSAPGPGQGIAVAISATLQNTAAEGFRQPWRVTLLSLAQSLAGLAVLGFVAGVAEPPLWASALIGGCGALFALHGARAVKRHLGVIKIDEEGIERSGARATRLRWDDLSSVRIAHFTTRRDGERGWMELVMKAGRSRLLIESEHPAFGPAVERAVRAAGRKGLVMSGTTIANAGALGLLASEGRSRPTGARS